MTYSINPDWLDRRINIWLIGVGGSGSELLDILARMHTSLLAVGHPEGLHVTAFDGDTVSDSNLVRQRFWHTDIGQNKAMVSIQRLNCFLGLDWTAVPFPVESTALSLFRDDPCDILITCVDSAKTRVAIAENTSVWNRLFDELIWLDLGNDEDSAQLLMGHLSTGQRAIQRLPNVYDLFPDLANAEEDNTPSCSTAEALTQQTFGINKTIATCAGNLLWSLFTSPSIDYHGVFLNSRKNVTQPVRIDSGVWKGLGYDPAKGAEYAD